MTNKEFNEQLDFSTELKERYLVELDKINLTLHDYFTYCLFINDDIDQQVNEVFIKKCSQYQKGDIFKIDTKRGKVWKILDIFINETKKEGVYFSYYCEETPTELEYAKSPKRTIFNNLTSSNIVKI